VTRSASSCLKGALCVLAVLGLLPSSAFAVAPSNDAQAGAVPIVPAYSPDVTTLDIPPTLPTGGWYDATSTEDATMALPTCLGNAGYRSMWYRVDVPEPSVLTVALNPRDARLYRPVVTISAVPSGPETACSLGGSTATQPVAASSYVAAGSYYVRIASSINPSITNDDVLPTLALTASLRDVTPPAISVAVSESVGVGRRFTFDASASKDAGSQVDPASAVWTFYDGGVGLEVRAAKLGSTPLVAHHAWRTLGLHRVSLELQDKNGNKTTYYLNVLVHSFVAPKVSMRVRTPKPGASSLRVVITHDMPVRVRLVVLQNGKVLRTIPLQTVKGFRKQTTLSIALRTKVARTGYVAVSGTASDLSDLPNTVPLKTCTVRPGKGGGVCA
jgi:hypothetical protein